MSVGERDVAARIAAMRQLAGVVTVMRGIAAARAREAGERLSGIRGYAGVVGAAIGEALALAGDGAVPEDGRAPGRLAVIAVCAEQGFAGAFSARVLDAATQAVAAEQDGADLLVVGSRGLPVAEERGLPVAWSVPMIAHAAEAPALAGRIAGELFERVLTGRITRITAVHAVPGSAAGRILAVALAPFDYGRFPLPSRPARPLIHLPPADLLARLTDEYVFAELCEALTLSFAAENEARMRAMIDARRSLDRMLDDLTGLARRQRQDGITAEIVELATAAGLAARRR